MEPEGTAHQGQRTNPVIVLLVGELVAFGILLFVFVATVKASARDFGAATGWVVLLSFLTAAVSLAVVFTAVVIRTRRRVRVRVRDLARRFPDAQVIPAYWSAALLKPSFVPGSWLRGVGSRGFAVTLVKTDEAVAFWLSKGDEPVASVPVDRIRKVTAITVSAPLGGRQLPAIQLDLREPTERLMERVQLFPTDDVGTELRDPELVRRVARSVHDTGDHPVDPGETPRDLQR